MRIRTAIFIFMTIYNSPLLSKAFTLPEENLALVGTANFSVLFWDIYDISLYSENGEYETGKLPILLKITYQRNIERAELVEETKKQWSRFTIDAEKKKAWLKKLTQIWPSVNKGDSITFYIVDHGTSYFYHNKIFIGKVESSEFTSAFANIWLDTNGPYPKMTNKLIGSN